MKPKEKPRKTGSSLMDALGLGKKNKSEVTPGQTATSNRETGAEVISILRSIDFAHGRLQSMADEDSYRTMSRVRDAAVKALMDAPTIFDKVEGIGETMAYAAKAWKTAVQDGLPNKADCAMKAIATGATHLWSNIPEDKEEERDAILKRREQYIENYKIAIQLNETIDRLHRSIAGIQQEIDKKREAEKAFAAEVKEMAKTPEGEARFARSYAAIGNVGILDGEDREFGIRLRENRINSQSIAMLKNQFASDRTQLSAARQQLEPVLLRLKKNPDLSGLEPAGRVAGILREMEDEQAHVISVAKIINTKMNDSISRMEAIMNSSDAQELQADDQSYLTAILRGNKISPQDKAVIEAERQRLQREELQRQQDEAAEKERIRDAVVGQLAVQEAKFDVNSIVTAQDMEIAMKKLGGILRQMYRMDHNVSVTKKDLKEARNLQFDNTVEPIAFSERAALVDERFVERIIQGESIADCLQAVPVGSTGPLESDMGPINFEPPAGGATAEDLKILQDQTGQDW